MSYLSYFLVPLEEEIYCGEEAFKEWQKITCSDRLSSQFEDEFSDSLYERQCFKLTDRLKDMYRTSRSSKLFFEKL